jgi:hypothetical protein
MEDSIYVQINNHIRIFEDTLYSIEQNEISPNLVGIENRETDLYQLTYEIDQFVRENEKTYERYLNKFLGDYLFLTHIAANPTVLIHYQQNTDF